MNISFLPKALAQGLLNKKIKGTKNPE